MPVSVFTVNRACVRSKGSPSLRRTVIPGGSDEAAAAGGRTRVPSQPSLNRKHSLRCRRSWSDTPPVRNTRLPFEPPSLVHRAQSQSTASPHPSRIVWAATWNGVASRGPLRSRVDLMIVSTTSHSTRCAGGREGALGSYRWWVGPSRWPAGEEVRRDSRRGPMPGAALRAHLFRGAAPQVNNPRPANGWAATRQNRRTGVMY